MALSGLSVEEKVAACLTVGYTGRHPSENLGSLLETGLGGVIFFRDNFQGMSDPVEIRDQLLCLDERVPRHLPRPYLSLDQEGGQVERLPHTLFPTGLTPAALTHSETPEFLSRHIHTETARRLKRLGFNLNFMPVLDLNRNPENPIIGVRSYGNCLETAWPLAKIAIQSYLEAGIIPVGKHYPGHGDGTIDSHLDLPTLHYNGPEAVMFRRAIQSGIPAMLVAHGFYPALQNQKQPSSLDATVVRGRLRGQDNFNGVAFSDDMVMGAISRYYPPEEAALKALIAGVDNLIYRAADDAVMAIHTRLVKAVTTGELPLERLENAVARNLALKSRYLTPIDPATSLWHRAEAEETATNWASTGIGRFNGNQPPLPNGSRVLLIHPDRATIANYAYDQPTSPELPALLESRGLQITSLPYPAKTAFQPEVLLAEAGTSTAPDHLLLVSFNPVVEKSQAALFKTILTRYPDTPWTLISAGTGDWPADLPEPHHHIGLFSYRPASMSALVGLLTD